MYIAGKQMAAGPMDKTANCLYLAKAGGLTCITRNAQLHTACTSGPRLPTFRPQFHSPSISSPNPSPTSPPPTPQDTDLAELHHRRGVHGLHSDPSTELTAPKTYWSTQPRLLRVLHQSTTFFSTERSTSMPTTHWSQISPSPNQLARQIATYGNKLQC